MINSLLDDDASENTLSLSSSSNLTPYLLTCLFTASFAHPISFLMSARKEMRKRRKENSTSRLSISSSY
jgi:hypothetical protein